MKFIKQKTLINYRLICRTMAYYSFKWFNRHYKIEILTKRRLIIIQHVSYHRSNTSATWISNINGNSESISKVITMTSFHEKNNIQKTILLLFGRALYEDNFMIPKLVTIIMRNISIFFFQQFMYHMIHIIRYLAAFRIHSNNNFMTVFQRYNLK